LDNVIDGVVITLVDITETKEAGSGPTSGNRIRELEGFGWNAAHTAWLRSTDEHTFLNGLLPMLGRKVYRANSTGKGCAGTSAGGHLTRMSFLTVVTPSMPRAISTALSMSAWELTKPLNCTPALEGFDIDFEAAQGGIVEQRRLHFGGDDRVIDVFAETFLGVRGGATHHEEGQENGQKENRKMFELCHDKTPDWTGYGYLLISNPNRIKSLRWVTLTTKLCEPSDVIAAACQVVMCGRIVERCKGIPGQVRRQDQDVRVARSDRAGAARAGPQARSR
jgi:hypothetical protein